MRILFYVEPLVERENPSWKKGWITHFVSEITTALMAEGCDASAFGCIAPTPLGSIAREVLPSGRIATIDQSDLIPRFGASSLEVSIGWYRKTLGDSALDEMANMVKTRLGNFSPDICISFSPAPFLNRAFPGCKVFHLEFGLVSRQPFPETVYFDPIGMFQSGSLAKFAQAIKAYAPENSETSLLNQFREDFCQVLQGNRNPLHDYIGDTVRRFESLVLLALQFSNFYAYDSHARFKDQYDLLIHTLESVPRHIGVVVCEHPEHPVLTESTIQYLRSKYPNFIWHTIFREVYSVSYYLMSYVQGVVTVSSSVGMQTLLWRKKLAVVGSSHLDFIADSHEVDKLIPELNSEWAPWKESVVTWLLSRFHLPFQPLCASRKLLKYFQGIQCDNFEAFSQSTVAVGWDAAFLTERYKALAKEKQVAALVGGAIANGDSSTFHAALYHATADHQADETYSVRRFVSFESKNEVTLAFPLPDRESPPHWLRFDPTNKPINVFLKKMWILDKKDKQVWEWDGSREALGDTISGMSLFEPEERPGVFLVCHTADPQIVLPIPSDVLANLEMPVTFWVVLGSSDPAALEAGIRNFQKQLHIKKMELLRATTEHERVLVERDHRLANLYSRMLTKEGELRHVSAQLELFQEERRELRRQLDGIYSSLMWRIMNRVRRVRDQLFPDGTRRGQAYESLLNSFKTAGRLETRREHSNISSLDRILKIAKTILPVSPNRKYQLVSFIFKRFGFVFQQTDSYQRWKERQPPLPQNSSTFPPSLQKNSRQPPSLIQVDRDEVEQLTQSFNFSYVEQPLVSIVIPVYNHLEYTVCCLASLLKYVPQSSFEVIIVDDASQDETSNVLSTIQNIHYVRNEENLGFLRSCNAGATLARGQFLLFLNNDTQVLEGWLDELVNTFRQFSDVGLVGSKLIYPNGVLQEAGAMIKQDGSAELIGLNADSAMPEFNMVREVDYCSGACLLLEAEVFKALGGFDERYAPCYCEDSDLAFRVRTLGKRVLYQPRSVVVHHLSVSTNESVHSKMPLIAKNSNIFVQRWGDELKKLNTVRAIAFYLPQYHPIPENDRWWGKGFTEWTNVTKARPNFEGHYQPHLPADLGFYDLRVPEVRAEQARLAGQHGLSAFCYYYYWFAGKKLLNRPLDEVIQSGAPNFPFCICWANENWTRRWDGCEEDILIAQSHTERDHADFIADIAPALMDTRYVRIQGKPLLIVYRLGLMPDPKRTADLWREYCMNEGIGDIYLAYVQSFERMPLGDEPGLYGFDAAIEFPPHRYAVRDESSRNVINAKYHGLLFDYINTSENFIQRPWPSYKLFRTVMPSWDNTARRQDVSHVFVNASPERYEHWLRRMVEQTRRLHFGDERIVFINAWNEWAEGNHLEPDKQFGHQYLLATKNALQ